MAGDSMITGHSQSAILAETSLGQPPVESFEMPTRYTERERAAAAARPAKDTAASKEIALRRK